MKNFIFEPRESFSRKTAKALIAVSPESLTPEIIEIGDLPLYNQDGDDDGKPPKGGVRQILPR